MVETILEAGGWTLFYLFLFFYVSWTGVERAFFAGEDPEAWGSRFRFDEGPLDSPAEPAMQFPFIPSLGRPA